MTPEEIPDFLWDFSDPSEEHVTGPPSAEPPQLCGPARSGSESFQPGSSQAQGTPASSPTALACGSPVVPGGFLVQNLATAPDAELEELLDDLTELFECNGQATAEEQVQPTAGRQSTQVPGSPTVTASTSAEPSQLCMPATVGGESFQQGSSQAQGTPASSPMALACGSPVLPGDFLMQDSATAPDEELEALLKHLTDLFECKGQATAQEQFQPTAGRQNTQDSDSANTPLADGQNCPVTASKVTVSAGGSQTQDLQCQQTLSGIQMTALCGGALQSLAASQPLSGGEMTVPGAHPSWDCGAVAIPVAADQSLSWTHTPYPWNGQRLNEEQVVSVGGGQTLSGGYQLVAVAPPLPQGSPGFPCMWAQLPGNTGNLQTMSYPLLKQSQRVKPYVCPHQGCGKSYGRAAYLRVHQRTHSGQKPYACSVQGCQWRFKRSDELKRHMRKHTGERPYTCDICKKSFARSDHVIQHLRVHT